MTDRIKKLTELVLDGKMLPQAQTVTFDRCDIFLPEDEKNAKHIFEYVTAQKPMLTEYSAMTGLFVFNDSVPGDGMSVCGLRHIREQLLPLFYNKPIENLSTFEWQHATANYNDVISKGINGIIADIEESEKVHIGDERALSFLAALKTCAKAMIAWAKKCSAESEKFAQKVANKEYKNNLLTLSKTLKKVPAEPAGSFYEAVLSVYILFAYDPDSLGVLDRTLRRFYYSDIEKGILTKEKAREYLQELYLMLQSKTPKNSDRFTRGGESHFCVGGYLPDGTDSFDELSMLIIESVTELPTYIPQVSLRWTKKLPFDTFLKVLDLERKDPHKRIAFVNDEEKIANAIEISGFTYEQACSYSSVGCNEVAYPGGMVGGTTNSNAARCIENTFFNRTEDILAAETFEDFYRIFEQEMTADLDKMREYCDKFNLIRAKETSYVTSLLYPDCVKYADSYSRGAVKIASAGFGLIGVVNVIDALTVVRQFVFDEKLCAMKELADALFADWQGHEDLLTLIKKKAKFFGNDDETSNEMARLYLDSVYRHLYDKTNVFGYPLSVGNLEGYNHHHAYFGAGTKATPDGRHSGEPLKFGIGQSGGYDRCGLSALLASVAKCDPHHIMAGSSVTNIYLDEQLVKNDDNFVKTAKMLESYFIMGGNHFQLNYVSKEDLKKAQITPEEYKTLRVRVSGFSDYFVNLSGEMQDDIIERTEHCK